MKDGIFRTYYESGQKTSEINYIKDKEDGNILEWYKNGQKN